jgi:hypothetical protein
VPHSPSESDISQGCIITLSDGSSHPAGSIDAPGSSEEVTALDGLTNHMNAPTSASVPPSSYFTPHRTQPSRLSEDSLVHSRVGQATGVSLSQDPMTSLGRESSSQGQPNLPPNLPTRSDWWDDALLAHHPRQDPSFEDEVHLDINLPAFDSATSFDTLFGMSIDDMPGQTYISDNEMTAWLNALVAWQ